MNYDEKKNKSILVITSLFLCGVMPIIVNKLLIVAATIEEVRPLINYLKRKVGVFRHTHRYYTSELKGKEIHIFIPGAGMVNTAFYLATLYEEDYDFAINAGIAGAFDRQLEIGECVVVEKDIFSELGAEDGPNFLKISELKLGKENVVPKNLMIPLTFQSLKRVTGITVNTVHGNKESIQRVEQLFHPQIESMEGAAFYFVCNKFHWKCCQIRAISNYVEERDKSKWNIPLAILHLNELLIQYIETL